MNLVAELEVPTNIEVKPDVRRLKLESDDGVRVALNTTEAPISEARLSTNCIRRSTTHYCPRGMGTR